MARRIGLASGVVPECTPLQTIRAAAEGGFDMVGLWVEPDQWTTASTGEIVRALKDSGLGLIDVEVIWIKPGPLDPAHLEILDIGMRLNASNALVVSSDPDHGATSEKLHRLCDHAAGSDLRVALEFGLFTDVRSIGAANAILDKVAHPAAALLVDALHLHRSGGTAGDVARTPRDRLSYAQLCDAPAVQPSPDDAAAILQEAVYGRVQVGEGTLDLAGLMAALPAGIPLSIELRSQALYDAFPNPALRAGSTADATRRFLATVGE